jgi:hypothetical protein
MASTAEEIPILLEKVRQEREAAAVAATTVAAVTTAVAMGRQQTEEGLQSQPLSLISDTNNEPKVADMNSPPLGQGDESSIASGDSSKTAFEVWVGGKLVGVAKSKDELPTIVAAAKAKEKLRKKFLKQKSKKWAKRNQTEGSSSSSSVDDEEDTTAPPRENENES